MTLSFAALNVLCPMHVVIDASGHITQAGPTLHKLGLDGIEARRFLEVFELYRPRTVQCTEDLLGLEGRKLHLRLRNGKRTPLKGHLVANPDGGAVIDMSFGITVVDAVRDYALTGADFAPTDLTTEMLYLVEAKSAAMDASRRLNTRLQGAMAAAEERAFTDTLTGLRNRRALDQALHKLAKSQTPFALMHIDLDRFKQVNDTLGHAAGDTVLKTAARIMVEETRKDDVVARVGGDEFVVLLPETLDHTILSAIADRLIARLNQPVNIDGQTCAVSASIGISSNTDDPANATRVMEEADIALYTAKRAGRARTAFFQPEPETQIQNTARRAVGE